MQRAVGLLLLSCLNLGLSHSGALGRTWRVNPNGLWDALSIQAGIDSAASGDTVLVDPATYRETIDFRGKDLLVRSSEGPAQTIIDGDGVNKSVVSFLNGESRNATLEGFTITNGLSGVWIIDSQPSLINNVISANGPVQDGGGIWCTAETIQWSPLIHGNVITNNIANNLAGGIGTGQLMVPEITENYIVGNEAQNGDGGGIYYRSFHNGAIIRGNIIVGNVAGDHGGGIYAGHVVDAGFLEFEVSWNLISGNFAYGGELTGNSGGGIWLWETNAWVHHNTIVDNTGDGPNSAYGGGIVIDQAGSPTIELNIVAFNNNGGGIWCGNGATPIIRNNVGWQNTGGDGVKDCPNWWQSNGNVIDNPYFCDMPNGDYKVASNSGVMTHPAGPVGAYSDPGCGPVSAQPSTWGALKARYQLSK